jgi:hypothetical protein
MLHIPLSINIQLDSKRLSLPYGGVGGGYVLVLLIHIFTQGVAIGLGYIWLTANAEG